MGIRSPSNIASHPDDHSFRLPRRTTTPSAACRVQHKPPLFSGTLTPNCASAHPQVIHWKTLLLASSATRANSNLRIDGQFGTTVVFRKALVRPNINPISRKLAPSTVFLTSGGIGTHWSSQCRKEQT